MIGAALHLKHPELPVVGSGDGGLTTGASAVALSYDPQDRRSARNAQAYAWDATSRLLAVTGVESYRYDGLGRRVQATRADASWTRSQYGQAGQMLYQENSAAGMNLDHVYLAGSLVAIRQIPRTGGAPFVRYQHTDALGSPVAGTDEVGALVVRTTYEPYGAALNRTVDGVGYGGQVMDAATGLVYMQQRYYDPAIGRFLSADPVQADANTGANFNRYAYAKDNPYRFTDPDGRYTCGRNKDQCTTVQTALQDITKAAANLKAGSAEQTHLNAVVKMFGKEGEKNGVSVAFGNAKDANATTDTKGTSVTITLNLGTMRQSFSNRSDGSNERSETAGTLAHEGTHGLDGRARGGNPNNRAQEYATEQNAYAAQAAVAKGLGVNSAYGLWNNSWSPSQAGSLQQQAVNSNATVSTNLWCSWGGACQ